MSNVVVSSLNDDDEKSINLVVRKRHLKEFIDELIGAKRSDKVKYEGVLRIRKADIYQIYQKIEQRTSGAFDEVIAASSVVVNYDGTQERMYEDAAIFFNSDESDRVSFNSVKISLIFLTKFPNSENPERQELVLNFKTVENIDASGFISAKIMSSNLIWVDDFVRFIKPEISKFIKKPKRIFGAEMGSLPSVFAGVALSMILFSIMMGLLLDFVQRTETPSEKIAAERAHYLPNVGGYHSIILQEDLIVGTDEWNKEVDYAIRQDYVEELKRRRSVNENIDENLSALSGEEESYKVAGGLFWWALKIFSTTTAAMIFATVAMIFSFLFVFATMLKKISKNNKSFIWSGECDEGAAEFIYGDFFEPILMGIACSAIVSAVFFYISLTL